MINDSINALEVIASTIKRCETAQLKFKPGTSQHSLLVNRLNALYIAKALLSDQEIIQVSDDELTKTLPPITSILSKCIKAQQKYEEGSTQYKRYIKLIDAMVLSEALVKEEINKRR